MTYSVHEWVVPPLHYKNVNFMYVFIYLLWVNHETLFFLCCWTLRPINKCAVNPTDHHFYLGQNMLRSCRHRTTASRARGEGKKRETHTSLALYHVLSLSPPLSPSSISTERRTDGRTERGRVWRIRHCQVQCQGWARTRACASHCGLLARLAGAS